MSGNSVGKNTSGDGVSVGDGVGQNMMGGVDVGIPGSVDNRGRGGLNLDLGSLNSLDSGNNMVGIGETSITEGGSIPVVGGGIDHGGYLTDGVNETILVVIFRITLKGNGLKKEKKS